LKWFFADLGKKRHDWMGWRRPAQEWSWL